MAELIASGTTQADSADFTVAVGTPARISLFNATGAQVGGGSAYIQYKASNGGYFDFPAGGLDGFNQSITLSAPGTYRVRKLASSVAFGVDKD